MPWCESCEKWRSPNALLPDGTCPRCRTQVETPSLAAADAAADTAVSGARIPWHFWVMVAATALYLIWRLIQGVAWLF